MSKRVLTGGTGDVNPQYLRYSVTESAANTFTQIEVQIPVLREMIGRGNMSQVIEVLGVEALIIGQDGAQASEQHHQCTLTTQAAMLPLSDADSLFRMSTGTFVSTNGGFSVDFVQSRNFTDQAGHGLIIATPSLFFSVQGVSETGALTVSGKILYRFKNISNREWMSQVLAHRI